MLRQALRLVFREGRKRDLKGTPRLVALVLMAAVFFTQIYWALFASAHPFYMTVSFYGVFLGTLYLAVGATGRADPHRPSAVDWLGFAVVLVASGYLLWSGQRLTERVIGIEGLQPLDFVAGLALVVLTIEAARRSVGVSLSIIAGSFVAYLIWGHHLTGALYHRTFNATDIVDSLIFRLDGIYGDAMIAVTFYVFMFVFFGALYEQIGGGEFFFNLARSLAGRAKGGPAKVAVIASGLYGMISGSPVADVATTGSITIPVMKRAGFRPEFAGAVEAVASSGGAVMPPVMGSAVFVMVGLTGIQYPVIAIAAIIPALLYYFSTYFQVHLRAVRRGFVSFRKEDIVPFWKVLYHDFLFVVPMAVLTWALVAGRTVIYAGVLAVLTTIAISYLRPHTRLTWGRFVASLEQMAVRMPPLMAAVGAAGIVVGSMTATGLNSKIISLLFLIPTDMVIVGVLAVGLISLVFGMGMPTVAVYALMAALGGPALARWGFELLPSHLFLVYFAVFAAITPPVAVAAYTAASIAQANPMAIGFQALRLGMAAFLVPIAFLYQPSLVLLGPGYLIAWKVFTSFSAITLACFGAEGCLTNGRVLSLWQRVLLVAVGVVILLSRTATVEGVGLAIGVGILLLLYRFGSVPRTQAEPNLATPAPADEA